MLCPSWRPLNASATGAGLPDAHRDRPSREAGSFYGQDLRFRFAPKSVEQGQYATALKRTLEILRR